MTGRTNSCSGGGSSSGGTITVTAPAGSTVTISKDGVIRTKTVSGTDVTFTGLTSGVWTVNTVKGTQSQTKEINLTLDYDVSIAFFSAFINVKYPAGSTCTATDGVTTLTAPNTSGTWACEVPNTGNWTVKSTDGSRTAQSTVTISADGDAKSVSLTYILNIYVAGQKSGFTSKAIPKESGGTAHKPDITYGSSNVKFEISTAYADGAIHTTSKIDLTKYNKLTFEGSYGGGDSSTLCIWSAMGSTWSANLTKSSKGGTSINISSLSGSYYIGFGMQNSSSIRSVTMTKMYLS